MSTRALFREETCPPQLPAIRKFTYTNGDFKADVYFQWDALGLRAVLREWQGVLRFGLQDVNRLSVVLPNVALASRNPLNNSQAYLECIEIMVRAVLPMMHQSIRTRTIRLPGHPSAVQFTTNQWYNIWLTKVAVLDRGLRCHTVRGVQLSLSVDGKILVRVRQPPTAIGPRHSTATIADKDIREAHRAVPLTRPAQDCLRRT